MKPWRRRPPLFLADLRGELGQRSADAAAALCRASLEKLKATATMFAVQLNLSFYFLENVLLKLRVEVHLLPPCPLQVRSISNSGTPVDVAKSKAAGRASGETTGRAAAHGGATGDLGAGCLCCGLETVATDVKADSLA